MEEEVKTNPLGTERVPKLVFRYALPSIIAMVIGAVYNIVDQLFIGNAVGTLGNAATNVVFPMTTICVALSLMFGVGGAANFNLSLGRGETEKANHYIGNAVVMLVVSGVVLLVVAQLFMTPLLRLFGATDEVMPYAVEYLRVTSIGFPCLVLTTGGGNLIRADGSPRMAMACTLTGVILNIGLDALFVMVFGWGMWGAAFATVIGEAVSTIIVIWYLCHWKTAPLTRAHLRLHGQTVKELGSIGMAPFFNQICMMVGQIVTNQSLVHYGELSVYGSAIPLACCGIIMKVYQIFFNVIIGLAQGAQPIESFNYGAKKYQRVKDTYRVIMIVGFLICFASFIIFRIFPRQILELFGSNTEEYFEFGVMFFRIFMLFTWLAFAQPITSNFFTAIGKPRRGVFLSMTRQLIFYVPLMLILPLFFGLTGVLYTAPLADVAAFTVTIIMAAREMREINKLQAAEEEAVDRSVPEQDEGISGAE